jgi:tetratricopeptide (TPR) repeat protein
MKPTWSSTRSHALTAIVVTALLVGTAFSAHPRLVAGVHINLASVLSTKLLVSDGGDCYLTSHWNATNPRASARQSLALMPQWSKMFDEERKARIFEILDHLEKVEGEAYATERVLSRVAAIYLSAGVPGRATEVLTRTVREVSVDPALTAMLGDALSALGDHRAAIDTYKRSGLAEARSEMVFEYLALATELHAEGRGTEARLVLDEGLGILPRNPLLLVATASWDTRDARFGHNKTLEAEKHLEPENLLPRTKFREDWLRRLIVQQVNAGLMTIQELLNLAAFWDWQGYSAEAQSLLKDMLPESFRWYGSSYKGLLVGEVIESDRLLTNVGGSTILSSLLVDLLPKGISLGPNLIVNGGFERWECYELPGWIWTPMADGKTWNRGAFVYGLDRENVVSGYNSLKIQGLWLENKPMLEAARAGVLQHVQGSTSRKTYIMSFRYRTRGLEDDGASVWVGTRGGSPPIMYELGLPATSGEWRMVWLIIGGEYDVDAPLDISLRIWQPGEAWFDEVSMQEIDAPIERLESLRYRLFSQ